MARIKVKNTITTAAQAEAAIARIDATDRQFAQWDLEEAEAVQRVREEFAEKRKAGGYAGLEAERALLVRELEAWAETASADWKKKTMEFTCGRLGFRVSQPAVKLVRKVARSFKAALSLLENSPVSYYIRHEPKIDREQILADYREGDLDLPALSKCGLTVDQTEEFWVESNASKDLDDAAKRLRSA